MIFLFLGHKCFVHPKYLTLKTNLIERPESVVRGSFRNGAARHVSSGSILDGAPLPRPRHVHFPHIH
jgi:hypothetical protein